MPKIRTNRPKYIADRDQSVVSVSKVDGLSDLASDLSEFEDAVSDITIDTGNLIVTRIDGTTFNAGAVGGSGSGAVSSVNTKTGAVVLTQDDIGDGTTAKKYTAIEKTKLAGVATGATANSSDATLKNRANHTGTQTASTISDFDTQVASLTTAAIDAAKNRANHTGTQTASTISDLTETVQDIVGALLLSGTGVSVSYDDATGSITITSTEGGGGTTDPEVVRDTIGAAIIGIGNINVAVNDAADTITVSTTATVNSTDAALRDRSTHTGTQSADTLTDGTTNKAYTTAEKTKLAGVATGATANDTDANLKNRANHTGSQAISTVTGLQEALDAKPDGSSLHIVATEGTYDSLDGTIPQSDITAVNADAIIDGTTNKAYTATEKTKLASVATGATANDTDANLKNRANHTGTQSADTVIDGTTNKAYTAAEKTKLGGIDAGATANSTDAVLKARANHTGTQAASTISDFDSAAVAATASAIAAAKDRANHTGSQSSATISDFTEAVQDVVGALLLSGSGVDVSYNDATDSITITATGGAGGDTDPEVVRDTIGAAILGVGDINVAVNDAADTITISTTATANSTDAALRDRSTHTGTQSADTITDGTTNKVYTATEKTKLAGVATGATANDTDANLKNRANHTGSQAISTVTNLQTTLDGKQDEATLDADTAALVGTSSALRTAVDARVTAVGGGGTGADAYIADKYAIERADATDKARVATDRAIEMNKYLNGTELKEPWANLSGWQTAGTVSVSGGKLVGGSTGRALKSFAFDWSDPTATARVVTTAEKVSGGTSVEIFLGLDLGTANHAPGTGDKYIGLGLNTAGNRTSFYSGMGTVDFAYEVNELVATPGTYGTSPSTGNYTISMDIGTEAVSFCIVDSNEVGMVVLTVPRADLAALTAGLTHFNIFLSAAGSNSPKFGPLAAFTTLEKSRDAAYAALDTKSRWVVPRYDSEVWAYQLPPNYDPNLGAPLVLFCHQSITGEWDELWDEGQPNQVPKVAEALIDAGYIIACGSDGGDRWGNQASLDNYTALYEYISKHHNVSEVFLWGSSMGGAAVLNLLSHRDFPTPRAAALTSGLVDMLAIWDDHIQAGGGYSAHQASLMAAYGMTGTTDAEFLTKTEGYRPEDREGWEFRGVPFTYWYGGTGSVDNVVEPGDGSHPHIDDLIARLDPYVPEATLVITDGPHGGIDTYREAEMVTFFNTYRHNYDPTDVAAIARKNLQFQIDTNTAGIASNTTNVASNTASIARQNSYVTKVLSSGSSTLLTTDAKNVFVDCTGGSWTLNLPATTTAGIEYVIRMRPATANITNVVTIAGTFVNSSGSITNLKMFSYNQTFRVISTTTSGLWGVIESMPVVVPDTGATHSADLANLPDGTLVASYTP